MKRKTFILSLAGSSLAFTGIPGMLSASGIERSSMKSNSEKFMRIRGGIPNSQYFFKKNTAGNQYLFFIGNSVLAGTGLKDPDMVYSRQMVNGFMKYFPESRIIERKNVQQGGSWFGLYRVTSDQPVLGVMIASGHLSILDFAGDDRNVDIEEVKISLEGVIREITLFRATNCRILLYTLTPEMLKSYRAGRTPEYIRISEQIADHYGIPSLNLAQYAAQKIIAGEISFEAFSADGINPTDAGAKIYAEACALFIDALIKANPIPDNPKPYTLPPKLFQETNDKGCMIAYEDPQVKRSGNWMAGRESPINSFRHILVSTETGAALMLKFKGSEIGIIDIVDKDSADFEYSIDGGAFHKLLAPKDVNGPTMRTVSLAKRLDRNAEHDLVIKIASPGTARMGGFLLNGNIDNPLANMSRLGQIDAVYASMAPISYQPPAGRFKYIPKAISKLRDGGDLRMVLLGDSIMGDTSASSFELLVMRDHPKCNLIKIPSLRSGTGCKYYREENRVQEYVLNHNPDLLVIGGISNGIDDEAVQAIQSVIQQVRAKKPDTEVLIITPVFGSMRDVIDAKIISYISNLRKMAVEECCALFDMTNPWWKYIHESGMTWGWFMRDAVHANERGCQIIARLLEFWFRE